jgi:acetylornithine/succinyldiaminopimelate/putrescine aminotransferase
MAASLLQFGQRHVARGVGRMANVVIASGQGCHVQLADGKKMLDFTCGIGVTNLGMPHPSAGRILKPLNVPRSLPPESESRSCRTVQQSRTYPGKYNPC